MSGISTPVVAGTASGVTVTVKDAYGNIATSYTGTIHFTSSDAQATLPADYTFQVSDNGTKTFSGGVIMKTAGEQWVRATDTVTATMSGEQTVTVSKIPSHDKKTNWGGIVGGLLVIGLIIAYLPRPPRRKRG